MPINLFGGKHVYVAEHPEVNRLCDLSDYLHMSSKNTGQ